ncbi:hypothetical protein AXE65_10860 [Ventosimonas gracilis]|uniref:YicC family protein n=1 Tax=Ventosimonas gracilis TaxID=1680762 RepID=A0A139SWG0_9GAMM|nr:YicC/YloC family endoribonuclease [Ventosimonas gracilis]KXU38939.1 hypothetical protein AXE65_10860 [Ventosimonas gracilis]
MVQSMTAFASATRTGSFGTLSWDLRSLNHRYLEVQLRLPEVLRSIEALLRESLRQNLLRGKVDGSLRLDESGADSSLQIDGKRADELIAVAREIAGRCQQAAPIDPLQVLAWPGVLKTRSQHPRILTEAALAAFEQALAELQETRAREGAALVRLLDERLDAIETEVAKLRECLPQMLYDWRQKARERLNELQISIDHERLEQELALLAVKSDASEELDRLSIHTQEIRRVLHGTGAVGRKLDFLLQELNREANTLAAKAFDPRSSQTAVNLKVLIEQIREQVQNIE